MAKEGGRTSGLPHVGYLKSRRNATGLVLRLWQDYMPQQHQPLTIRIWNMRTLVIPVMAQVVRRRALDPSLRCYLDEEITRSYWDEVMRWIEQAIPTNVRRIVDLGAGTGAGTFPPSRRFDHAEVVAVDVSDEMLERIRVKRHWTADLQSESERSRETSTPTGQKPV